jgi:hypothetical protein
MMLVLVCKSSSYEPKTLFSVRALSMNLKIDFYLICNLLV